MPSDLILSTRRALPGLLLAFAVAALALVLVHVVPLASPALTAIILGALATNTGMLAPALQPGLDLAAKKVLRIGIVLLGLQVALGDILALGPMAIAVIVAVVVGGMATGLALGRILRLPPALTMLVSCGFSICGAAAVAAASGAMTPEREDGESEQAAIERLETQTATAVALVVVFGTLMIPAIPLAATALGLSPHAAGIWAGASIHEVAQVVAAGAILGPQALTVAVLVKLGRVLMLAPVIAGVGILLRRRADGSASAPGPSAGRPPLVPMFVLAFLIAVVLRSSGVIPGSVLSAIAPVQSLCLAAAMFALGTGVRMRLLRQVGSRPVVLGAAITLVAAGIGLIGAHLA